MIELAFGIISYFIIGAIVMRVMYNNLDMDEQGAFIVMLFWPLALLGSVLWGAFHFCTWLVRLGK